MKEERNTGVFIDIDREFFKEVKKYCVNRDMKVKTFVRRILEKGIGYEKKSVK